MKNSIGVRWGLSFSFLWQWSKLEGAFSGDWLQCCCWLVSIHGDTFLVRLFGDAGEHETHAENSILTQIIAIYERSIDVWECNVKKAP